jgi:hypothetical protein
MYATAQKEQFSLAYTHAVASTAGFGLGSFAVDDDSVDVLIAARGKIGQVRSPRLDLQLKCTQNLEQATDGENWKFQLSRKNYDDLRPTDLQVPRLLVVLRVPPNSDDWISHSPEQMVLRHCAFWRCLYGEPELAASQQSVVVTLPRQNVFDVVGLKGIVERIGQGVKAL